MIEYMIRRTFSIKSKYCSYNLLLRKLLQRLVQKYNFFGEIVQITAVFFSKQRIIRAFCGYELENSSQSCKFVGIYLYMNEEHSSKKACKRTPQRREML